MKLVKQNVRHSCLGCCFAMIMDCELEYLNGQLQYSPDDIIHPELDEPKCRRGYVLGDLIIVAYKLGHLFTPFYFSMLQAAKGLEYIEYTFNGVEEIFQNHDNILLGHNNNKGHAVVWNSKERLIYDPVGYSYPLEHLTMTRECFLLWTKRN